MVIPAADSWPLSVSMLDACVDAGIPAIMSYPAGALGRVCSFMPGGPYASECLTMPYRASYDDLKVFMESKENRSILYYYRSLGGWTQEWFEGFCEGKLPHPQIAPIVWISGTLASNGNDENHYRQMEASCCTQVLANHTGWWPDCQI